MNANRDRGGDPARGEYAADAREATGGDGPRAGAATVSLDAHESLSVPGERQARHAAVLALAGFLLAALVLLGSSYRAIVEIWLTSDTYAHGLVVLPICIYLLWRARGALADTPVRSEPLYLVVIVVLLAGLLLARAGSVQSAEHAMAVLLLPAGVVCFLGTAFARKIAFPLAYLAFAIPIGDVLVPPLQDFTALFSTAALRLTGIPVLLEGRFIYLPTGTFEVAEACSGIRYLIAMLALGCLYAYLTYDTLLARLIFIAISVVLPIIANAVRAYLIIIIAYTTNNRVAVGFDHIIYGWVFFGVVVFLLFLAGNYFRHTAVGASEAAPGDTPDADRPRGPARRWVSAATLALAVSVLLVVPGYELSLARQAQAAAPPTPDLPPGSDEWNGPHAAGLAWDVRYPGATHTQGGRYENDAGGVELRRVFYATATPEQELIDYGNQTYDQQSWTRVHERYREIGLPDGPIEAVEIVLKGRSGQLVLWYWYQIGEYRSARPIPFKIREALYRLRGAPILSTGTHLAAAYRHDPDEARRLMRAFLESMQGGLSVREGTP